MKILFCQTQFKLGGQQKVLLTIAKKLSEKHEVVIYYENYDFYDLSEIKTVRPKKFIQVWNLFLTLFLVLKTGNLKKKIVADEWHLKNLKSTLKNTEFDVVVLLNPYILFVNDIKKGLIKTKKVVCWTHNLYENYVYSCFKDEKEMLFNSMKNADLIISLESYTASKWKKVNQNTIVINNPVTINTNNMRADLSKKIICCAGRIQLDSKGLDFLCEIAEHLNDDIKIKIAGTGKKNDEKIFLEMIKEKNLEEKIIWVGGLKNKDLLNHYKNSSIFLMTSRYERFPLVAVDAMSLGLPFVGFDIPSLREVTLNGKYGKLFELGKSKEVAFFLNEFINDKELLKLYSDKSIERSNQLSLEKIIEKWEKQVLL